MSYEPLTFSRITSKPPLNLTSSSTTTAAATTTIINLFFKLISY